MIGEEILKEIGRVLNQIDNREINQFIATITDKKARFFIAGCGRTGYIMRAFAMRLMHMGITAFYVGDTITPGAGKGDVLIIGSGSGETDSLVCYTKKAKMLGMKCILLSTREHNSIAQLADETVVIASGNKSELQNRADSIQPMGALFEQSLLILLDWVVLEAMKSKNISSESMYCRHANLE